jgi:hypothetical protein
MESFLEPRFEIFKNIINKLQILNRLGLQRKLFKIFSKIWSLKKLSLDCSLDAGPRYEAPKPVLAPAPRAPPVAYPPPPPPPPRPAPAAYPPPPPRVVPAAYPPPPPRAPAPYAPPAPAPPQIVYKPAPAPLPVQRAPALYAAPAAVAAAAPALAPVQSSRPAPVQPVRPAFNYLPAPAPAPAPVPVQRRPFEYNPALAQATFSSLNYKRKVSFMSEN